MRNISSFRPAVATAAAVVTAVLALPCSMYAQVSAAAHTPAAPPLSQMTPDPSQVSPPVNPTMVRQITGDPNAGELHLAPQVNTDRSVTFRFIAPHAETVAVSLEGQPAPLAMTRSNDGVWTVTSPVLQPEIYGYHYVLNSAHFLDPTNRWIKTSLLYQDNLLMVRGDPPAPWERTPVAHGNVTHTLYHSGVIGADSDYWVYTPPSYDPRASVSYPVLYLLHGYSDSAAGWIDDGMANLILDNLIAGGKVRPMIVVMTRGYGAPEVLLPTGNPFMDPELIGRNYTRYTQSLLQEVMPAIARDYRALTGPANTAIAGLSMGGAETIYTGVAHPEIFGYVAVMSAAPVRFDAADAKLQWSAKRKLLWIACGDSDPLVGPQNKELKTYLHAHDVQFTDISTPGMHTWMVWRDNLVTVAPLLFR